MRYFLFFIAFILCTSGQTVYANRVPDDFREMLKNPQYTAENDSFVTRLVRPFVLAPSQDLSLFSDPKLEQWNQKYREWDAHSTGGMKAFEIFEMMGVSKQGISAYLDSAQQHKDIVTAQTQGMISLLKGSLGFRDSPCTQIERYIMVRELINMGRSMSSDEVYEQIRSFKQAYDGQQDSAAKQHIQLSILFMLYGAERSIKMNDWYLSGIEDPAALLGLIRNYARAALRDPSPEDAAYNNILLINACKNGEVDKVKALVTIQNADVNAVFGRTNPLIAACQASNLEIADFLLENGADPNGKITILDSWVGLGGTGTSGIYSPTTKVIEAAWKSGSEPLIELLHAHGAEINKRLVSATVEGNRKVIRELLDLAAQKGITLNVGSAFVNVCKHNYYDIAEFLLRTERVDADSEQSAFIVACHNNIEFAQTLLARGHIDQHARNTALLRLCGATEDQTNTDNILFLLSNGANPNTFYDGHGVYSPLWSAIINRNRPLAILLIGWSTAEDIAKNESLRRLTPAEQTFLEEAIQEAQTNLK